MSDLDELVTTERVRSIFEAREEVKEHRQTLGQAVELGRIDDGRARRLWHQSVNAFVHELEGLLNPPEGEPNAYWTDEEIGQIPLPDGSVLQVEGLSEYLDLKPQMSFEVEVMKAERYCEIATPTVEQHTVQPSWRLLRDAFHKADEARTELGLELTPDNGDDGKWEFREIEDVDDINPEEWNNISAFDAVDANGGET